MMFSLTLPTLRVEVLLAVLCHGFVASALYGSLACYLPNGSNINNLPGMTQVCWMPCQNFVSVTGMCCGIDDQACTTDGLCISPVGVLFRDACTDPEWGSSCTGLFKDEVPDSTPDPTACDDGSYCLWNNATGAACCQADQGVFVSANGTITNTKPSATLNVLAVQTATSTPAPTSGLSSGDKTAIALGVILGAVILIAGFLFLNLRRKSEKERKRYKREESQHKRSFPQSTDPDKAFSNPPVAYSALHASEEPEAGHVPYAPPPLKEPFSNPLYQLDGSSAQDRPYELETARHTRG